MNAEDQRLSGNASAQDAAAGLSAVDQVHHSALYLAPVVVGIILPLVSLPIITRILSKEDYGAWALANVYGTFAMGLAGAGLPIAYERNFFEYNAPGERGTLLYSILSYVTLTCFVLGLVTWVIRERLSIWVTGVAGYGSLLFWTFCVAAVVGVKAYYLMYFRNMTDVRAYVRYTIDENVTGVLLSLFFVAVLRTGVIGLALGQLLASAFVLALVVRRSAREVRPAFSRHVLGEALVLSYPLAPRIFLKFIGGNFDKYLVGLLSSVGGVGVYAIGQRLAYAVFVLMNALENVFNPQVYRRMFSLGAAGGETVGRYLTPYVYVSVGAALLVAAFAKEAIAILTPSAYHGAVPVVALLSLYYASLFFGKLPQLVYAKKTFLISILAIVNLALNLTLIAWFTERWGATGAAAGTLVAGLAGGIVHFALSQHYYPIPWGYRGLGAMFALLGVMVAASLLLSLGGIAYWAGLLVRLGIVAAYLWLGARLGVVTAENRDIVRGLVRRCLPGLAGEAPRL